MSKHFHRPIDTGRSTQTQMQSSGFRVRFPLPFFAAFARYPSILESYEAKRLTHERASETVNLLYSVAVGTVRVPVAIGEN